MFDTTYLMGLGDMALEQSGLDWLRAGARLPLRRVSSAPDRRHACAWRGEIEVQAPDGRRLGYLPPDDSVAVAAVIDAGLPATACVTAVVPTLHRPRVHVAIEVGPAAAAGMPA